LFCGNQAKRLQQIIVVKVAAKEEAARVQAESEKIRMQADEQVSIEAPLRPWRSL